MKTAKSRRKFLRRLKKRAASWGSSRRPRGPLVDPETPAREHARRRLDRVPTSFAYRKPLARQRGKEVVRLCETPILRGSVQVVRQGAPENLHSHEGIDGYWMVLRGRARFFGPGNVTLAELGPHEGILIPRAAQYGFESTAAEDLELLQVLAYDRSGPVNRQDYAPKEYDRREVRFFDARRPLDSNGEVAAFDDA
jgi:mannose-6-phosphate isomerase-like protein (cupin superfamily)